MYIYGYIYLYMCIYLYIYIYIHNYIYSHMNISLYIEIYRYTCIYKLYMYKNTYVYICHFFVTYYVFDNASGMQIVDLEESFRMRFTGVGIWLFPFREGVILDGELARAGWGNQGKRALGEPRGTAHWTLYLTTTVRTLISKA